EAIRRRLCFRRRVGKLVQSSGSPVRIGRDRDTERSYIHGFTFCGVTLYRPASMEGGMDGWLKWLISITCIIVIGGVGYWSWSEYQRKSQETARREQVQ